MAREEKQSCPEKLVATRRGESNRRCPLPPGGGWQPPGRPGAALGSWVATRGGKSSRWYIFPMEAAGSHPAGSEQLGKYGGPCEKWWQPGKGKVADDAHIFP